MTIKFRRSTGGSRTAGKRALGFIVAIILVSILLILGWQWLSNSTKYIDLHCLSQQQFIIGSDTTNYEKMASTLIQHVAKAKTETDSAQLKIRLYVPKNYTVAQLDDILQLCQAVHPIFEIKVAGSR